MKPTIYFPTVWEENLVFNKTTWWGICHVCWNFRWLSGEYCFFFFLMSCQRFSKPGTLRALFFFSFGKIISVKLKYLYINSFLWHSETKLAAYINYPKATQTVYNKNMYYNFTKKWYNACIVALIKSVNLYTAVQNLNLLK